MPLRVILNGNPQEFATLEDGVSLAELVAAMELKPDRIAVERNGEIVARRRWSEVGIGSGDKLEIVHFVGGGAPARPHDSIWN